MEREMARTFHLNLPYEKYISFLERAKLWNMEWKEKQKSRVIKSAALVSIRPFFDTTRTDLNN